MLQRAKDTHLAGVAENRKPITPSSAKSRAATVNYGRAFNIRQQRRRPTSYYGQNYYASSRPKSTRINSKASASRASDAKLIRPPRPPSSYGRRSSGARTEPSNAELLSDAGSGIESLDGESLRDSRDEDEDEEETGEDDEEYESNSFASSSRARHSLQQMRRCVQLTLRFEGINKLSRAPRAIRITQQIHSGGNDITIFDLKVRPHEEFTAECRSYELGQFCLTIFVDNVRDFRIATCCQHRHEPGVQLGHFTITDVADNGEGPCSLCKPPTPPPTPPPPKEPSPPRSPVSSSSGESIPEVDYQQELAHMKARPNAANKKTPAGVAKPAATNHAAASNDKSANAPATVVEEAVADEMSVTESVESIDF